MDSANPRSVMEASLIALGDTDIRGDLFERFFQAYPDQRASFYNIETSSRRMTNETVEAMIGLAEDEKWVPHTVSYFVDLHRVYGPIAAERYTRFVDLLVDTLADALGADWTAEAANVWRKQAERLKTMLVAEHAARNPA